MSHIWLTVLLTAAVLAVAAFRIWYFTRYVRPRVQAARRDPARVKRPGIPAAIALGLAFAVFIALFGRFGIAWPNGNPAFAIISGLILGTGVAVLAHRRGIVRSRRGNTRSKSAHDSVQAGASRNAGGQGSSDFLTGRHR